MSLERSYSGFYPWRLFWRFFRTQILVLNGLFLLALGIASFIIDFNFYNTEPLIVISIFFLLSVAASAFFAFRFASPFKRVILKALRIANRKQFKDVVDESVLEEEPGEYFELEMALEKINKKLKKRRMQLAHEREESQALMGSLEDAVISVNISEKILFCNSRFSAQFLSESQTQDMSQISLSQIFREPEVLAMFRQTLESGESTTQSLKMTRLRGGGTRFFSMTVSPLLEEKSREVYGAMGLFHDITELKMLEQIRIEFVENASHELRTPLTSVKGFLDTLKEDVANQKLEQLPYFLGVISKNVDRLTELVNDLLTLSSLESHSPLQKNVFDPHALTLEMVERLAPLADEKQIKIKVQSHVETLCADEAKVEQVLQNLIGNAIKYIPVSGEIQVFWELKGDRTVLRVVDNGPGIAEEHLPRLFERFYRIDKDRSRDRGGTGLGLAIAKHIMSSHGGSISVKSKLDSGAEFICTF